MESLQSVPEFTQIESPESADTCTVKVDISTQINNVILCVTNVICEFAPTVITCSPANLKNACPLHVQASSFSTSVEPYSISTQTLPPLNTQSGVVTPVQYNTAIRWTFTMCHWYMNALPKLPVVFPSHYSFSLANTRCNVPQDYVAFSCQWKVFDPGIINLFWQQCTKSEILTRNQIWTKRFIHIWSDVKSAPAPLWGECSCSLIASAIF